MNHIAVVSHCRSGMNVLRRGDFFGLQVLNAESRAHDILTMQHIVFSDVYGSAAARALQRIEVATVYAFAVE